MLPLLIGAGALAAGSAVSGAVGSENARAAQEATSRAAMDMRRDIWGQQRADQWDVYDQQRADMAPWLKTGHVTLAELVRQMGAGEFDQPFGYAQLANDPGFQFRMAEGQKALERSASARGLLNSGGALKGLARYSQGLASDEYQNAWARNQADHTGRFNRLAALAGVGQQAAQNLGQFGAQNAANLGQFGSNFGGQMSNLYGALGNAQSAGAMGMANAVSGGLQSLGNMALLGGLYGAAQSIPTQPMTGSMVAAGSARGWGPGTYGGW